MAGHQMRRSPDDDPYCGRCGHEPWMRWEPCRPSEPVEQLASEDEQPVLPSSDA